LKKENGGFDLIVKTAARLSIFCWGMKGLPPNNGFFIYRWAATCFDYVKSTMLM